MGEFNRYFVLHGDATTVGGEVIGTATHMTIHGKHTAIEGDKVKCPACNSVGVIKCVPPMRTITGHAQAQFAMDGDLCMCNCSPKPRLIASQKTDRMGFGAADVSTPSSMPWFLAAGHKPEALGLTHSIRFHAVDRADKPMPNMPYRVTLADGSVNRPGFHGGPLG